MIGTFWNLCSACPSMPVDKLHSEYRSTYRWHEYTGPRQEVIRRPPQPVPDSGSAQSGGQALPSPTEEEQKDVPDPSIGISGIEPAFPRRKKNPALAQRTHEFLAMSEGCTSDDSTDTVAVQRARSEERVRVRGRGPSRRSKSEGPPADSGSENPERTENKIQNPGLAGPRPRGRARPWVSRCDSDPCRFDQDHQAMIGYLPSHADEIDPQPIMVTSNKPPPAAGVFKSAVSKISTEYRLQFAWPRGATSAVGGPDIEGSGPPRKSLSMGAIKPANQLAPTHKKRMVGDNRAGGAELEPLVDSKPEATEYDDGEEKIQEESLSKEEKPLLRNEFNTEYKKKFRPFSQYNYVEGRFKPKKEPEQLLAELQPEDSWYQEVLELRRKAGEYKHRGWGTELVPQHIAELYNKQITLWEQVSRRSSLSALSLASTTPKLISKEEKDKENNKKSSPTKITWVRQSPVKPFTIYDRASVTHKKGDKYDDNKKDKRSRKEAARRHNLERSGSAGRSQSVGPTATFTENTSPKRSKQSTSAVSNKALQNGPSASERRPRPTTLPTSAPSRTKSSCSGSVKMVQVKSKALGSVPSTGTGAGYNLKMRNKLADRKEKYKEQTEQTEKPPVTNMTEPERDRLVKSPPEPTRVKSPEQILMRSPEPVNWTVPLDTGKTFTVTQNVHEDVVARPHSEVKSWTPATAPPPAPQSAPPQLDEHPVRPSSGWKSPESEPLSIKATKQPSSSAAPQKQHESAVKGTTLKCVDDPSFAFDVGKEPQAPEGNDSIDTASTTIDSVSDVTNPNVTGSSSTTDSTSTAPTMVIKGSEGDGGTGTHSGLENPESSSLNIVSQTTGKSLATDVFEKARSRFDNFWGKSKDETNEKEGKV